MTRDVAPGDVVAGTPARVVCSVEDYETRLLARSLGTGQMSASDKRRVFLDHFGRD